MTVSLMHLTSVGALGLRDTEARRVLMLASSSGEIGLFAGAWIKFLD
jgi:hypothetical protein